MQTFKWSGKWHGLLGMLVSFASSGYLGLGESILFASSSPSCLPCQSTRRNTRFFDLRDGALHVRIITISALKSLARLPSHGEDGRRGLRPAHGGWCLGPGSWEAILDDLVGLGDKKGLSVLFQALKLELVSTRQRGYPTCFSISTWWRAFRCLHVRPRAGPILSRCSLELESGGAGAFHSCHGI